MISKLFLISLAVLSPFVPQTQVYEDFDTFQITAKYAEDFDYVVEKRISLATVHAFDDMEIDSYTDEVFIYYAFPINYDIDLPNLIYSNSFYNFYNPSSLGREIFLSFSITNYIGSETFLNFIAFTSVGMSQIIAHDKELPVAKTLYGSFFAFFTGFFPQTVVAEYNGIFTAIVVAFLLFLVFGFIFFLFRTIRRLMGFR